jgi:hypothetical protein
MKKPLERMASVCTNSEKCYVPPAGLPPDADSGGA